VNIGCDPLILRLLMKLGSSIWLKDLLMELPMGGVELDEELF